MVKPKSGRSALHTWYPDTSLSGTLKDHPAGYAGVRDVISLPEFSKHRVSQEEPFKFVVPLVARSSTLPATDHGDHRGRVPLKMSAMVNPRRLVDE